MPGERLPSTRELARGLGISRGMVVDCFDQLQAEGYLVARAGSATRVAETAQRRHRPAAPPVRTPARLEVDFRPAVPDLASFPRADWARTVAEVCRSAANAAFDYGDPRGRRGAARRCWPATWAGSAARPPTRTGPSCAPASPRASTSRCRAGRRAGWTGSRSRTRGTTRPADRRRPGRAGRVRVPVDEQGLRVDELAATGAGAVVVTPAHQWPTGVVLSPARRRALADWARRTGGWVVEDDYDAEFRYDREPVGAVQGLAPDRVVTIGTVSKSLAPALRLGWLLCPADLVDPVADLKVRTDRGSPGLDQLVLARLIESGRFDRHLRRMRRAYAAKREVLVRTLAERARPSG